MVIKKKTERIGKIRKVKKTEKIRKIKKVKNGTSVNRYYGTDEEILYNQSSWWGGDDSCPDCGGRLRTDYKNFIYCSYLKCNYKRKY